MSTTRPLDKVPVRFIKETRPISPTLTAASTPPGLHLLSSCSSSIKSPESERSATFTFGSLGLDSMSSAPSPLQGKDIIEHRGSLVKNSVPPLPALGKPRTVISGLLARPGLQRSMSEMPVQQPISRPCSTSVQSSRIPRPVPFAHPRFSGGDIDLANKPFNAFVASAGHTPGRALLGNRPSDMQSAQSRGMVSPPSCMPQVEVPHAQTFLTSPHTMTRWLRVTGLPKTLNSAHMLELTFGNFGTLQGMWTRRLAVDGVIIVSYYDSRDANKAFQALGHMRFFNEHLLSAEFVSRPFLKSLVAEGTDVLLSSNIGEVSIALKEHGECPKDVLYSLFCSYGDIKSFQSDDDEYGGYLLCEYFDLRDAALAVRELDVKRVRNCTLIVRFVLPDETQNLPSPSPPIVCRRSAWDALGYLSPVVFDAKQHPMQSTIPLWMTPDLHPCWTSMTPQERRNSWKTFDEEQKHRITRPAASAEICPSAPQTQKPPPIAFARAQATMPGSKASAGDYFDLPSGPSESMPTTSPASQEGIIDDALKVSLMSQLANFTPSPGTAFSPTVDDNDRNKVQLNRITEGLDKRTTIMIKNIPNKFTQAMLKDWLDETSLRAYDFLYLRIDFQNKCNVGYAFVNFIEPAGIVAFSQRRYGQYWQVFSSEKRCDISYANIQSRDKLIEKFRNSSVMDQEPAYRPKLFYASGAEKGEEEAFPLCNDPKKKARSALDAQTTGLFPPFGSLSNSRNGTPQRTPVRESGGVVRSKTPSIGLPTPPLTIGSGNQDRKDRSGVASSPLAKMSLRTKRSTNTHA